MSDVTPAGGTSSIRIASWLFLTYVFFIPIVRPFNLVFRGILIPYVDLIFPFVLLFWLAALLRKETSFRGSKAYFYFGLYFAALVLSTCFSSDPLKSAVKLVGILYLISVAAITYQLLGQAWFGNRLLVAWIAGAAVTSLGAGIGAIGFYLGLDTQNTNYFLSHYGSLPPGPYPRVRSFFENANMMANYLNVALVMPLALWAQGRLGRTPAAVNSAAILAAAFLTFSPGLGGLALTAGILFGVAVAPFCRASGRSLVFAGVFLAVVMFAATLISADTPNTDVQVSIGGVTVESSVRVLVWKSVFERFRENPVLGKGTGTDAADVRYTTVAGHGQVLRDAHNAWLNVLGESGLVGLAAFSVMCWYFLWICRFDATDKYRLALSAAFVGAFLYQNLTGSFEDARPLWILMGMMIAASGSSGNALEEAFSPPVARRAT